MCGLDNLEALFVISVFLFQIVLIIHFAVRKRVFKVALRYGWIVYWLSVPAAVVSVLLLSGGKVWWFWLGGFVYLVWAGFGFTVEYVRRIEWRDPIRWPIFGPYLTLYLATIMLYWWPLARISRPLWIVYAGLFIVSTVLNVTSHQQPQDNNQPA